MDAVTEYFSQSNRYLYELLTNRRITDSENCIEFVSNELFQFENKKKNQTDNQTSTTTRLREEPQAISYLLIFCGFDEFSELKKSPWRRTIVETFESNISLTPYQKKIIGYDEKAQNHEKISVIADYSAKEIKELRKSITDFTSLDDVDKHRRYFFKALNKPFGNAVALEILPDGLTSHLQGFYKILAEFTQLQEDPKVVDHYEEIQQIGLEINRLLESSATPLGKYIAEHIVKNALTMCEKVFSQSRAILPATVTVEPHGKKYPLYEKSRSFDILLKVKNEGPGYANRAKIRISCDELCISNEFRDIGRLPPNQIHAFSTEAVVKNECEDADLLVDLVWDDFDGSEQILCEILSISSQASDVDWENAGTRNPYSLEPIHSDKDLVGRRTQLDKLVGGLLSQPTNSWIITGQKRVGKTSIGKSLISRLNSLTTGGGRNVISLFVEGGDYVYPKAEDTIKRLGESLATRLKRQDSRLRNLETPVFDTALTPLVDFIDEALSIVTDSQLLIMLDEFDELPQELYERGNVGNSFFLTLRSIGSRDRIGFVLIGGEKIKYILDCQGVHLNKWGVVNVDYFSRQNDWSDYSDLVCRPVKDTFEIDNDALVALHNGTAGNPYFTNLICGIVYDRGVSARDSHITAEEVKIAVEKVIEDTNINTFQHFWTDGMVEPPSVAERKTKYRRRVLYALADSLSTQENISLETLSVHKALDEVPAIAVELQEFVARNVLVENNSEGDTFFNFKVPLFRNWLSAHGITAIDSGYSPSERRRVPESVKVSPKEVVELVDRWPLYLGEKVTEDRVRAWLDQFGGAQEQRAMFCILKQLHFVNGARIREGLREIDTVVRRGGKIIYRQQSGKKKREDVLVSYLGGPGKSGVACARTFVEVANIYAKNVVELSEVTEILQERDDIQGIFFLDDFVGTGTAAKNFLSTMVENLSNAKLNDLKIIFASVIACESGWREISEFITTLPMSVEVHTVEVLGPEFSMFSNSAEVFSEAWEFRIAKELVQHFGSLLEPNMPMGFGDMQLALVFERGIPNNSLPILWSQSENWRPLFPRHI